MRTYSQNRPIGNGPDTDFHGRNQKNLQEELQFYDSTTIGFERTTRGITAYSKVMPRASQGMQFQMPNLELDSSTYVPAQTVVYISPENSLVTAGLNDLVAGQIVKATAGLWVARKNVPAATDAGYNVPQLPYPGATGMPAGEPLAGDADGTNVFWIFLSSIPVCPTV